MPASLKPHKGTFHIFAKRNYPDGRYNYTGYFQDHPQFGANFGHISLVVKEEGDEVETLNSRYTVVRPSKELVQVD